MDMSSEDEDKNNDAKKRGGRQTGSRNYTATENTRLLDLVEKYRPIGQLYWDKVAQEFNERARELQTFQRDKESLKHKFQSVSFTLFIYLLNIIL
jgi:hypothetical protein